MLHTATAAQLFTPVRAGITGRRLDENTQRHGAHTWEAPENTRILIERRKDRGIVPGNVRCILLGEFAAVSCGPILHQTVLPLSLSISGHTHLPPTKTPPHSKLRSLYAASVALGNEHLPLVPCLRPVHCAVRVRVWRERDAVLKNHLDLRVPDNKLLLVLACSNTPRSPCCRSSMVLHR